MLCTYCVKHKRTIHQQSCLQIVRRMWKRSEVYGYSLAPTLWCVLMNNTGERALREDTVWVNEPIPGWPWTSSFCDTEEGRHNPRGQQEKRCHHGTGYAVKMPQSCWKRHAGGYWEDGESSRRCGHRRLGTAAGRSVPALNTREEEVLLELTSAACFTQQQIAIKWEWFHWGWKWER